MQIESRPRPIFEQAALAELAARPDTSPNWLRSFKNDAIEYLQSKGMPSRSDEIWRFVELVPIVSNAYRPFTAQAVSSITADMVQPYLFQEPDAVRLVFVNGFYAAHLSSLAHLSANVTVVPLQTALVEQAALVESFLADMPEDGRDAFYALNTASFQDGALIDIPENLQLTAPIQLLFLTTDGHTEAGVSFPRVMVRLGEHAQAAIGVSFVGHNPMPPETYLTNSVAQIHLAAHARLEYAVAQMESDNAFHLAQTQAMLQSHSQLKMTTVATGGKISRHFLHASLLGEHADCQLNGLSVLMNDAHVHDHLLVDHAVPNCTSSQLYKGILDDHSRSEFMGTIRIHKDAQKTDANQLNQSLLLSDDARVFTRPQLRIDADDVKCTHGATVGQLDENQIFYLASRGLSSELAQSVLTFGFAEEIIERISIHSLHEYLDDCVQRHLRNNIQPSPRGK